MCLCLFAVVHLEKSGDNMLKGFTFFKSYLLLYVLLMCVCVCECACTMHVCGQRTAHSVASPPLQWVPGIEFRSECLQQVLGIDLGLFL